MLQVLDPTSYHENPNPVDPLGWQIRKTEADMYMSGIAAQIRVHLRESNLIGERATASGESKSSSGHLENLTVDYAIREGKTAENIVNFAHAENIDLLVISTHGSGGLTRWNISSVTQKVINLIYLPVLIVRAYNQPEMEDVRIRYRRILLPIDSSRRAECSLSAGVALAHGEMALGLDTMVINSANLPQQPQSTTSHQIRLILAAVITPPEIPIPEPYPMEIEQLSDQLMRVSRQAVIGYLTEMKNRLAVECETIVLENKSVSSAIQELASQKGDIDLVVLCAHGYTGQSTWPYGSIARNYMEHGNRSVLVIQDVLRSQVQPTVAEISAEKSGGR